MLNQLSAAFANDYLAANGQSLQDPVSALNWCLTEAASGSAPAQCVASFLLWSGRAGVRDEEQAFYWCKQAADAGVLDAKCSLASHLISGSGTPPNPHLGVEMLAELVDRGHLPAMVSMALLKLSGHVGSLPRDIVGALDLLTVPAESGDPYAQSALAMELLRQGRDEPGLRWLIQAAASGDAAANEQLSSFYRDGSHGLPIDSERAAFHAARARRD